MIVTEFSQTCQGWVMIDLEAEDFLDRLRGEFVGRNSVHRVVAPKRN